MSLIRIFRVFALIIHLLYIWSIDKSIAIRTGRHCVFKHARAFGLCDKISKARFYAGGSSDAEAYFEKICADSEAVLEEFNGETEHVHLLITYPPKVSVAKLVNSLKGASSRLLKKYHPDLVDHYYQ